MPGVPLVGNGIAAEDKLEAMPLERVAHGTVERMDRGPTADRHAIFLIDDLVLLAVIELVNFQIASARRNHSQAPDVVPLKSFLEFLDEMSRPQLGRLAARPPNVKRTVSPTDPAADPQGRQVADVVGVQ